MPVVPFIPLIAAVAGPLLNNALSNKNDSGGSVAAAPAPTTTTPTVMPNAQENEVKRASIADQLRRRGRASTILTDTTADTLG